MSNELDLARLQAVAEAATQGEWDNNGDTITTWQRGPRGGGPYRIEIASEVQGYDGEGAVFPNETDATHIATFDPPAVRALIARVTEAEALIATGDVTGLQGVIDALFDQVKELKAALAAADELAAQVGTPHTFVNESEGETCQADVTWANGDDKRVATCFMRSSHPIHSAAAIRYAELRGAS